MTLIGQLVLFVAIPIGLAESRMNVEIAKITTSGIIAIDTNEVSPVSVTARATFAFAIAAMALDVPALGAAESSIAPAASSGESPIATANEVAPGKLKTNNEHQRKENQRAK